MVNYRTRFFLFISLLSCAGCKSPSRLLSVGADNPECFQKFVPEFKTHWYKASIDVTGNHMSGLLLFKSFGDSLTRVVFTNEAGTTFFDFGFEQQQTTVNFVLPQLDRKPVIRTLQNDLDLILMRYARHTQAESLSDQKLNYLKVKKGKKTIYIIVSDDCQRLMGVEEEWGGKKKIQVTFGTYVDHVPDSVAIVHHNFNMQINLRKLQR